MPIYRSICHDNIMLDIKKAKALLNKMRSKFIQIL